MSRFQIEDIVEQDKHGVIFRALDVESGRTVALRRFLPFGQDGGGLQKEEALAFEIAAQRLSGVLHEALRSVISGSVDPIDGIPYLVTEWVDGMSLREVLDGENLDPALVIDVLRIALEVSIAISQVLGEEAVWVETGLESIVIGTENSGRGFTFWISPFKWLGAQFESRKLSSIVDLGEQLTGWKRKVVSDQAGSGLGGWLKWLKKNPDVSLTEALEMLATSTGKEFPSSVAELVESASNPKPPQFKLPSTKKPLLFAALVALLVIPTALFFLYKSVKPPQIAANQSEGNIAPAIQEAEPIRKSAQASPPLTDPAARASALAKKLRDEAIAKNKPEGQATGSAAKAAPAAANANRPTGSGKIYAPGDRQLWLAIKTNDPVKLGGILRGVRMSKTGKSIYLDFSTPPAADELAGVLHKRDFKGDFLIKSFEPMIGKKLVLTGSCFKEPGGKFLLKISEKGQIEMAK
jgi:hypothetical protein